MANRARIRCVNKQPRMDPHHRIQNVGGLNDDGGAQPRCIEMIEEGWEFYVSEAGLSTTVVVDTHLGNKYIRTRADRIDENNLLLLPECPA